MRREGSPRASCPRICTYGMNTNPGSSRKLHSINWIGSGVKRTYSSPKLLQRKKKNEQLPIALSSISAAILDAHKEATRISTLLADIVLDDLQQQVTFWTTRLAVMEQAAANARKQCLDRESVIIRLQKRQEEIRTRLSDIENSMAGSELGRIALHEKASEFNKKLVELGLLIAASRKRIGNDRRGRGRTSEAGGRRPGGISTSRAHVYPASIGSWSQAGSS